MINEVYDIRDTLHRSWRVSSSEQSLLMWSLRST